MNKLKVRRWTGVFGIVACVLLIAAFPLYFPFVRDFVVRLRNASKTSTRSHSLKEKVVLSLNYELEQRTWGPRRGPVSADRWPYRPEGRCSDPHDAWAQDRKDADCAPPVLPRWHEHGHRGRQ